MIDSIWLMMKLKLALQFICVKLFSFIYFIVILEFVRLACFTFYLFICFLDSFRHFRYDKFTYPFFFFCFSVFTFLIKKINPIIYQSNGKFERWCKKKNNLRASATNKDPGRPVDSCNLIWICTSRLKLLIKCR